MIDDPKPTFKEWCVLELMGHRKLAGLVSEQEIAGHGFLRLDIHIPLEDAVAEHVSTRVSTQFYSPSSVYAITPVTEDTARRYPKGNQPVPVTRWELPQLPDRDPNRPSFLDHVNLDPDDEEAVR